MPASTAWVVLLALCLSGREPVLSPKRLARSIKLCFKANGRDHAGALLAGAGAVSTKVVVVLSTNGECKGAQTCMLPVL